ncbi:MAG TPA: AsmA family protein, partial [Hyphomicrobiaceae bacterium]|nr:AsmA family protein [Hyphomicrobiaceae bacterium]
MSNFIIAIAVFLITVVGALFAIPYFVDWNGYRSVFEEEATRLLGREVRVGGAVNLHLLPTPYFRFEKVRIADASVNLQEPFFRADSLTVKLAIPPMVRGVLEANDIELLRPVLRLALDNADGWNWQSFGEALARAAFLPAKVTLSSVKIVDGVLALHGPDGTERTRFEAFDGELSTPALEGPYRLRGTFGAQGDRELRIATARAEGDGNLRFKAVLRVDGGASTYTLDGRVADLMGKPSIEGDISARVPVAGLWQAQPTTRLRLPRKPMRSDPESGADKGEATFELRAQLHADPAGARLSDLSLAFEQDGRPQLVSGEVKASWRTALAVELSLASRWLDLDRIAGAGAGAGPLASIVPLAVGLRDLLPGESQSRATISIDQANVGREAVSGVHLALVRTAGKLAIEDLRLGLPGGSRGELKGNVTGPPDAPVFEGSIGLRGTSLVRFLSWATAGAFTLDPRGDGSFGARAQLAMTRGRASLRNIVGDLSGGAVFADAQYAWEGRPELRLRIESPQLDARAFIPAGASLGEIFDTALRGPIMSPSGDQSKSAWRGPQTDAFIRLNAGQLFTAARSYRDVGIEIALEGGRLRIPALRLTGDEGFSLELEGEVDDAAVRPKGNLRGVVVADRGAGVAPLAELIGVPEVFRPD